MLRKPLIVASYAVEGLGALACGFVGGSGAIAYVIGKTVVAGGAAAVHGALAADNFVHTKMQKFRDSLDPSKTAYTREDGNIAYAEILTD